MRSYVSKKLFLNFFCIVLFLFCAKSLSAQITSEKGAIRIAVTDPQGAAISGAKISLSSKTGAAQTKESSADGSAVFPLLDPGAYNMSVESPNFKRTVLGAVAVHVTEVTNLNVVLELGEVSAEVVVSGDSVQTVNTSNATLGNVLTEKNVQDLPLSTRNFTFLLALNAGTSSDLPDATQAGRGEAVIFVAGQRGTANNLVINGTDSNELLSNNFSTVPVPSPDSIEEFRVQTSLYDASQGKTSGGNVDVLTRGGTNTYHGEAYEFFRNDDMNSNLYFFNATGTPRPVLKQNQFGGNFGGPVPKLKDTFIFLSYEGTRQINGVAGSAQALFPVLPAQRTQANIESAFGLAPGSLDPTALALLNAPGKFNGFLIPSGQGTPGQFGEATFSEPLLYNEDQFNLNVDRNIGNKHKISERFFFSNSNTNNPLGGEDAQGANNNSFGSGNVVPITNRLATIAWTYTISPTLINEMRFGYNRITLSNMADPTASLASVGMTRFNSATNPEIPLLLSGDIGGGGVEFGGASTNFDQADVDNTFNFADTLAWTHGKHTFRIGAEYRRYQINLFNNFAENGFLFFNSFDEFLQGSLANGESFVGTGQTGRDFRGNDIGAYFQDDWKITRRLTLNLGLRYDYMGPLTDTKDRIGNFDPSRLDTIAQQNAGPGLLNGFILPSGASFGSITGTPGVSGSTLFSNSPHNFAPRVSLAFDPKGDGKTSIRAGYGIYYVRTSGQTLLQLITSQPFFQLAANVFGTSGLPSLSNPFPNLPTANQFPLFSTPPSFAGFDSTGNTLFNGNILALNPFSRNLTTPYVGNWNLTVQRELPGHFNIEVGYVGSEAVHLLDSLQRNQALLVNAANPRVLGGFNGVPQTILTTNSVNDVEARAGVLGFDAGGGLNQVTDLGHSSYNAFIFTVNHRTGNLFLQASYTYSRSIDNESGGFDQDLGGANGNQLDIRGQRAVSDFNVPHRLVVAYEYNVPGFKTGRLSYALGHWSVGGISTFQSGTPISIICGSCSTNLFGVSPTSTFPNLVGNLSDLMLSGRPENFTGATGVFNSNVLAATPVLAGGTIVSGLNVDGGPGNQSFTIGPSGGALFGDLGRNIVHNPFEQNWDLYLSKKFQLTEKYSITFRSEAFNVFNHPNFIITNNAFGDPGFGVYSSTIGNPRILQLALKFDF